MPKILVTSDLHLFHRYSAERPEEMEVLFLDVEGQAQHLADQESRQLAMQLHARKVARARRFVTLSDFEQLGHPPVHDVLFSSVRFGKTTLHQDYLAEQERLRKLQAVTKRHGMTGDEYMRMTEAEKQDWREERKRRRQTGEWLQGYQASPKRLAEILLRAGDAPEEFKPALRGKS